MSLPTMAIGNLQKIADRLAGITKVQTSPKSKRAVKNKPTCTIYCDPKKTCPGHHVLVGALMNCSDHLGPKSNLAAFQNCVEQCVASGWQKDDVVPDESEHLRLPLLHMACAFAKCTVVEWLCANGFDPHVKSESTGQFALQQGIKGVYKAKHKGTHKELLPKIKRYINVLKKQLLFHDDVNGDTPLHTAALMLTLGDSKPQFFEGCVELIVKEAFKMEEYQPRTILDAINNDGKTALHILASSVQKVEWCASAIRTLVLAGADKTIRDNEGQTPLDVAFVLGVQNIVDELLKVHSTYGVFQTNMDPDFEPNGSRQIDNLYPSPSLTDDSDTNWNEAPQSTTTCSPVVTQTNHKFTQNATVTIKQEKDTENCECYPAPSMAVEQVSTINTNSRNVESSSPAVLKYLGDAGLLSDVSALVARARAQDEASMRKLQNQAKEYDIQIRNKENGIEKMKAELLSLQRKRKECDVEYEKIAKRIHSCENAMKELPNL